MAPPQSLKTYPLVTRRRSGSLVAKSASLYPSSCEPPLESVIPSSLVCLSYSNTDKVPRQCVSDGSLANRPSRPTGYAQSGRVPSMAYMSEPTAVRYRARSVFSSHFLLRDMITFERSGDLAGLQSRIPEVRGLCRDEKVLGCEDTLQRIMVRSSILTSSRLN